MPRVGDGLAVDPRAARHDPLPCPFLRDPSPDEAVEHGGWKVVGWPLVDHESTLRTPPDIAAEAGLEVARTGEVTKGSRPRAGHAAGTP